MLDTQINYILSKEGMMRSMELVGYCGDYYGVRLIDLDSPTYTNKKYRRPIKKQGNTKYVIVNSDKGTNDEYSDDTDFDVVYGAF